MLKDSTEILAAMKELATDAPLHPARSGPVGERAVFQRNPYYLPSVKSRSWETALNDIGLTEYALSSKEAFIQVVSRGLPGTDHPGISGLTSAQWDSAYAAALTMVLLAILGVVALAQFFFLERKVHYQ